MLFLDEFRVKAGINATERRKWIDQPKSVIVAQNADVFASRFFSESSTGPEALSTSSAESGGTGVEKNAQAT
jgi:hypothetical protein